MGRTIFVTGGHGFIGSVVVAKLLEAGHDVRCLVRKTSDTSRIDGLNWTKVVGDMRDRGSLAEGIDGCDTIVHLASPSSWDQINSPAMTDIVVDGTRNLLELAVEHSIERVVFCSSILAVASAAEPTVFNEESAFNLDDSKLAYSKAKHAAEAICTEFAEADNGVEVVTVNPGEVYGPNDIGMVTAKNLIDFATSSPVLVCHGGTPIAHIDDVADGIIAAMEKGANGKRYILGGDNLTVKELAQKTLGILGQKKKIVTMPTGLLRGVTKVATTLRIPLPYEPEVIPYATRYWFMDNTRAREELGVTFRPAEQTLEPVLEWLKEAGHID